jgi:DNA-binding NarL/FixJ family response regulator
MSAASAIVFITRARMLGDLLIKHFAETAPDIGVVLVDSFSERVHQTLASNGVYVFVDFGFTSKPELIVSIRKARGMAPSNTFAILTLCVDHELMSRALALRVKGFISVEMGLETLVPACRMLLAGGELMPSRFLLEFSHGHSGVPLGRHYARLTERERQILDLVRQGKPNKIIAAQLELRETVIKNQIRKLMRKTGTQNRLQLALAFGWDGQIPE